MSRASNAKNFLDQVESANIQLGFRDPMERTHLGNMKSVQQRWAAHVYEIRPRADTHRVDLISDALPYRPIWYRGPNAIRNAINSAKFRSRSHRVVIRVYDAAWES